nr:2-C-methyl-D-erythritol 4-phosphate cytidylyltransferase [uncultured Agathobaculum sp.]
MLTKRKRKNTLPIVCAVIVAAGSSQRMGGVNKLLLPLADAPVLAHTLTAFQKCDAVRDMVLVCREADILPYTDLARAFGISKLRTVIRGGDSRTDSVLAGVRISPADTPLVAVHDGARPLVSEAVITEAAYAAAACGAAAPVVPVKDSIKRIEDGRIAADVPRATVAAVQTPQIFDRALLLRALETAARQNRTYTDDCAAVEALGHSVQATHGSYENIKITTPEDMLLAEALLHREAE